MDAITKLYWQFHVGEKFNFYKLSGFRAGYTGKKLKFNNFERLPEALVGDWMTGYIEGREMRQR